jgi:hypothetical protein
MSIPRVRLSPPAEQRADLLKASYDPRRVFRFNLPKFDIGPKTRAIGTYAAGGLVSSVLLESS